MIKKTLSLKDAMRSLHVVETDEGIELQSPAGTAKYDVWGVRREVNGIPEYFPISISINKRSPAPADDKSPPAPDEQRAPLVRTMKLRVELDTTDAQKVIDELSDKICSCDVFKVLNSGRTSEKNGTLIINKGQVFITDAKIGDSVASQNYSVKMSINNDGKEHVAGMAVTVEGDQRKVVFEADRFKVHEDAQSTSNNEERALNGALDFGGFPGTISHVHDGRSNATKTILTDEMREAIISAVRESDLFTSLQTAIAAQAALTSGLQQAMVDAAHGAIRNGLKPGGLIYGKC